MKTIKLFLSISTLLFFNAGCEKDADVKLPKTEPKLVVTSFISPQDTFIKVWVKRTSPIFEANDVNTSDAVVDAVVTISDGSSSAGLVFDPSGSNNGYYKISTSLYPIVADKSYTINVSTPDTKSATATTTVPVSHSANFQGEVDVITLDSTSVSYERQYHYAISWDDIPGSGTNYRLIVIRAYYDSYYNDTTYTTYVNAFINDEGKDGQQLTYNTMSTESVYDYTGVGSNYVVGYNFYLYRINDDYYSYHNTLIYSGDDPFSEPTLVYSNVTGGLGAFCAYNELARIIKR